MLSMRCSSWLAVLLGDGCKQTELPRSLDLCEQYDDVHPGQHSTAGSLPKLSSWSRTRGWPDQLLSLLDVQLCFVTLLHQLDGMKVSENTIQKGSILWGGSCVCLTDG
jgi:hypothetical protein